MSENLKIPVVVPEIGHGNPFSAQIIVEQLGEKSELFLLAGFVTQALKRVHRLMTSSKEISEGYTKKSADLRSLGQEVIALLLALEMMDDRDRLRSESKIFIQEFGLLAVSMLGYLSVGKNYFFVPDVFPKRSATNILRRTGARPMVWNRTAFEELEKLGFKPILVAPVLPDISQEEIGDIDEKKVVLKASGSGISKEFLEFVINSTQLGHNFECWMPDRVKRYKKNEGKIDFSQEKISRDKYFNRFSQTLRDAGEIICYPSEMIQVIASLKKRGWQGKVRVLPPRGEHEKRNLDWAIEHGLIDYICVKEEKWFVWEKIEKKANNLDEEIGKKPITEAIIEDMNETNRILEERIVISSESLSYLGNRVAPFWLETINRELVTSEVDVSSLDPRVVGIHFKSTNTGVEFVEQLKKLLINLKRYPAQDKKVSYVTVHLENLRGPNEDEIRRVLEELNQQAENVGVYLLFENVTQRVDEQIEPCFYSLFEFERKFGRTLERLSRIGYCLDIAHLGLSESVLLEELCNLSSDTSGQQDDKKEFLKKVFERAKTLHWSRSRRQTKPSQNTTLFEIMSRISLKLPSKKRRLVHEIYTKIENLFKAHYSVYSEEDLFKSLTQLILALQWSGKIVIESPLTLQILREGHQPLIKEVQALIDVLKN